MSKGIGKPKSSDALAQNENVLGQIGKSLKMPNAVSAGLSKNYLGRLAENLRANDAPLAKLGEMAEQWNRAGGMFGNRSQKELAAISRGIEIPRFEPRSVITDIEPLTNPIHETNEHLVKLSDDIQTLVSLQAKQAEMVNSLLATITKASLASGKSGKANTRIAQVSLAVSLLAFVSTLL